MITSLTYFTEEEYQLLDVIGRKSSKRKMIESIKAAYPYMHADIRGIALNLIKKIDKLDGEEYTEMVYNI